MEAKGIEKRVMRTERGWAGHFCCALQCRFRRNTLLECGDIRIVVSTVGLMESDGIRSTSNPLIPFMKIGVDRYFETMAFHSKWDGRYWDADVERVVPFDSDWAISEVDADDKANDMHETVVDEITRKLASGCVFLEESA